MNIFQLLIFQPLYNFLALLCNLLKGDLGWAVLILAGIIRLIIWPWYKKAMGDQRKIAKLQPKIKEIHLLIGFYQKYISPLKPATCRFYPTCSEYTAQALKRYGLLKGLWLSAGRILRCHPFNPGGYDPLPDSSVDCAHKK